MEDVLLIPVRYVRTSSLPAQKIALANPSGKEWRPYRHWLKASIDSWKRGVLPSVSPPPLFGSVLPNLYQPP